MEPTYGIGLQRRNYWSRVNGTKTGRWFLSRRYFIHPAVREFISTMKLPIISVAKLCCHILRIFNITIAPLRYNFYSNNHQQHVHTIFAQCFKERRSGLMHICSLRSGNFEKALQVQLFLLLQTSEVSVSILTNADGVVPCILGPDVYETIHSLLKGLLVKSSSSLACELEGVSS